MICISLSPPLPPKGHIMLQKLLSSPGLAVEQQHMLALHGPDYIRGSITPALPSAPPVTFKHSLRLAQRPRRVSGPLRLEKKATA